MEVATGLEYLHSLDLCHGDLRAENILLQYVPTAPPPSSPVLRTSPSYCTDPRVILDGQNTAGSTLPGDLVASASVAAAAAAAAADFSRLPNSPVSFTDHTAAAGRDTRPPATCHVLGSGLCAQMGAPHVPPAASEAAARASGGPGGHHQVSTASSATLTASSSCAVQDYSVGQHWNSSNRWSLPTAVGSTCTSATGGTGTVAHGYGNSAGLWGSGARRGSTGAPGYDPVEAVLTDLPSGGVVGSAALAHGDCNSSSCAVGSNVAGGAGEGGAGAASGPPGAIKAAVASPTANGPSAQLSPFHSARLHIQTDVHHGHVSGGHGHAGGAAGRLYQSHGAVPTHPAASATGTKRFLSAQDSALLGKALNSLTTWPESPPTDPLGRPSRSGAGTAATGAGGAWLQHAAQRASSLPHDESTPGAAPGQGQGMGASSPNRARRPMVAGGLRTALSLSAALPPLPPPQLTHGSVMSPAAYGTVRTGHGVQQHPAGTDPADAAPAAASGYAAGGYMIAGPTAANHSAGRLERMLMIHEAEPLSLASPEPAAFAPSTAPAAAAPPRPPYAHLYRHVSAAAPHSPLGARTRAGPVCEATLPIGDDTEITLCQALCSSSSSSASAAADTAAAFPATAPDFSQLSTPPSPFYSNICEPRDPGQSEIGLVCNISGVSSREFKCSFGATPATAAAVSPAAVQMQRVAKLTDPWLSLATLPPEVAGGPWSPAVATAAGFTSGADVSHLPPELLLSGRLHPSSDVYSFGITCECRHPRPYRPTHKTPSLQALQHSAILMSCTCTPAPLPCRAVSANGLPNRVRCICCAATKESGNVVRHLTARCTVIAPCVAVWRMLSPDGEAPYARLHPAEAAYKVTACGMRPALPPALPDPLRRLVEDCWQSDPTARPNMQQVRGAGSDHVRVLSVRTDTVLSASR